MNRSILFFVFFGSLTFTPAVTAQSHVLGQTEGQVTVKRSGWKSFVKAVVGTVLENGDRVRLGTSSSHATVFCADASVQVIQNSEEAVQCPSNRPPVVRFKGSRVTHVRGGPEGSDFPIVVSPRMTKVIDPHPVIRWLPVKDATSYRVSLMKGAQEFWSSDVGNVTELVYPTNAPALTPGVTFIVVVAAGFRTSAQDDTPNLGFSVVSSAEAQQLAQAVQTINSLNLPDTTKRFVIANLYAFWGIDPNQPNPARKTLTYDAINQLSQPNSQTPAMVRLLGDLYLRTGLNSLAEEQYRRALSLSENLNDPEGKALAQLALGRIFKVRLNDAEATQRLNTAKALFDSYGDAQGVAAVEAALATRRKP